jgi:hypothetical protein
MEARTDDKMVPTAGGEKPPPPPPQLGLDLVDEPRCACNCSFVHTLCCTPDIINRRGVIPDATIQTQGIIAPEEGHCCNRQTGDMEALPAGKHLDGTNTMCV